MSTTAKALILTWVAIGFLLVGAVGFYLGRLTAPKSGQPSQSQMGQQNFQPPQQQQQFGQQNFQPSPPQQQGQQNFQQPPQGQGGFQQQQQQPGSPIK